MITPLILFAVLIAPFWLATAYYRDMEKSRFAGAIGLSIMFFIAALGHFYNTDKMTELIPGFFPYPELMIIITGLVELVVAAGLLFEKYRKIFGWIAIILFISFLPFNIYGAIHAIGPGGHQWGLNYLLLRIPLQLVFIIWTWWFCITERKYKEIDPHIETC